jgi:hypothetical protein
MVWRYAVADVGKEGDLAARRGSAHEIRSLRFMMA